MRATRNCSRAVGVALAHNVDPEVVRQGCGARQRQTCHDGQNRGKCHGGNEAKERRAAHSLCEQRCGHVAAGIDLRNRLASDHHHGAETEHEREQVEEPDERRRIADRPACGPCVRHGVEAHQDVRQAGRAEHQRQPERNRIERIGDQPARRQHAGAVHRCGRVEQRQRVEAEPRERQHRQQRGTAAAAARL